MVVIVALNIQYLEKKQKFNELHDFPFSFSLRLLFLLR